MQPSRQPARPGPPSQQVRTQTPGSHPAGKLTGELSGTQIMRHILAQVLGNPQWGELLFLVTILKSADLQEVHLTYHVPPSWQLKWIKEFTNIYTFCCGKRTAWTNKINIGNASPVRRFWVGHGGPQLLGPSGFPSWAAALRKGLVISTGQGVPF